MNLIKLYIKTGNQKYPIFIGNNILKEFKKILKENLINFNQCLVVADKNVPKKLIHKVINFFPKKKRSLHVPSNRRPRMHGLQNSGVLWHCRPEQARLFWLSC